MAPTLRERSDTCIRNHVGYAAAAAIIPVPVADMAAIAAVELEMFQKLNEIHGRRWDDSQRAQAFAIILASEGGRFVWRLIASWIKSLPGPGTMIGGFAQATLAGAVCYSIGKAYQRHLETGAETIDEIAFVACAKANYSSGEQVGREAAEAARNTSSAWTGSFAPYQIRVGDQSAWVHDAGAYGGLFHTYDALQVAGPQDQPRKVHVWLPPGYAQTSERCAAIYANDGHAVFFPAALSGQSWNAQRTVAQLIARGEIPPTIIVAIEPLDRAYEYLHVEEVAERKMIFFPVRRGGGLEGYAGYVAGPIRNFFDANYRTNTAREYNVTLGSSHGGLASSYTAVRHADRFGAAIAMSPSFWAGEVVPLKDTRLLHAARPFLRAHPRPKVWLDWGLKRSGGPHNRLIEAWATQRGREMVQILKEEFGYREGHDLFWVEDEGAGHTEVAWASRLPAAVAAVLGGLVAAT